MEQSEGSRIYVAGHIVGGGKCCLSSGNLVGIHCRQPGFHVVTPNDSGYLGSNESQREEDAVILTTAVATRAVTVRGYARKDGNLRHAALPDARQRHTLRQPQLSRLSVAATRLCFASRLRPRFQFEPTHAPAETILSPCRSPTAESSRWHSRGSRVGLRRADKSCGHWAARIYHIAASR